MSLLSQINEASARRGVQVYGQPPARRQQQQPVAPVMPRAPVTGTTRLDQMAAMSKPAAQQQAAPDEGEWYEQGIGVLLNNPIVKTALMPLDFIDKARRASVYGFGELARQGNPLAELFVNEERAAEANEAGFSEALKDADYGFGDIAEQFKGDSEWAKWANRATGFAGDVLLDPTTYVTLGTGAGTRFAGRAGRQELAGRASRAGLSRETIKKASEYGIGRMSRDELAQLGIRNKGFKDLLPDVERVAADLPRREQARNSLRFLGQAIPGTERAAGALSYGGTAVRRAVNKTRVASKARYLRTAEGFQDAADVLATGKTRPGRPEMDQVLAAELIDGHNADRVGRQAFQSTFATEVQQLAKGARGDLQTPLREAERSGEGGWVELFSRAADVAQKAGLKIYRDRGGKDVQGWIPHVATPDALKWLRSSDDVAVQLRQQFGIQLTDMDKESGLLAKRFFKARDEPYIIKGREVLIKSDTVDGVNAAFAKAFPELKFKFLDDNIASVASNYLTHLGRDVGKMAQAKRLRQSKAGLVLNADDSRAMRDVADDLETGIANDAALAEARIQKKKFEDVAKGLREETEKGMGVVGKIVTPKLRQALSTVEMLYKPATAKQGERGLLVKGIKELMDDEITLVNNRDRAVDLFERLIKEHDDEMDQLVDDIAKLERESLNAIEIAESAKADTSVMAQAKREERRRLIWEMEANAAELEIDRETLRTARDHIAQMEYGKSLMEPGRVELQDALASEESLAHYGGQDVSRPGPGAITAESNRVMDTRFTEAETVVSNFRGRLEKFTNQQGSGTLDEIQATREAFQMSGQPVPPEVEAAYVAQKAEADELRYSMEAFAHARDRIGEARGVQATEPVYRKGFSPAEIDANFKAQKEHLESVRDAPAPLAPPPFDAQRLGVVTKRMAELDEQIALAATPPSGRTLPELQRAIRVNQKKVDTYEAWRRERLSRYSKKNIPQPMDEQEFAAARQAVADAKAEIDNIAANPAYDPAAFKAALAPLDKEIKAATTARKRLADADARRTRAENELDAAIRRHRGLGEPGPVPTRKLPPKVPQDKLATANRRLADAEAARANLLQSNMIGGDAGLRTERAALAAEAEKLDEARRIQAQHATTLAQDQLSRKRAERALAALPSRHARAKARGLKTKVGNRRLPVEGERAVTERVPMMTPTDIRAQQSELAIPKYVIPDKASHPVRQATDKAKLPKFGSPELGSRADQLATEWPRVRETAERLVENDYLDPEFAETMDTLRLDMMETRENYSKYPVPFLIQKLESQVADLRRYSEFTLRYGAAIEAGAEAGDDLARYTLRKTVENELNVVTNERKRLQTGKVTAVDDQVERAADMFKSMIKTVDSSMNGETWVKKLNGWVDKDGIYHGGLDDMPVGEQKVWLQENIKVLENMQDDRIKNLAEAKARLKYLEKNPEVLGDEVGDLSIIATFQREQEAARHAQGRFRQPERTVTREQYDQARANLRRTRATRGTVTEKVTPEDRATIATYNREQKALAAYNEKGVAPKGTVSRPQYTAATERMANNDKTLALYGRERKAWADYRNGVRSTEPPPPSVTRDEYLAVREEMKADRELIATYNREQKAGAPARGPKPKQTVTRKQFNEARARAVAIQRETNAGAPLARRSEIPDQELIDRFEAERKAAASFARGDRKTRPTRTVSDDEATAARERLAAIRAAKTEGLERGHTAQTAISDLRTRLHTAEDPLETFSQFMMSDDPSAMKMDVVQALMALPPTANFEGGRVASTELMRQAGIPLRAKRKVIKMKGLTPNQRRDLAELTGEALAQDTSDRSVFEMLMQIPDMNEDKANYWMRKARIGGRTPKPTKMSSLGVGQKDRLAALLGAPMPSRYENTAAQERRLGWRGPRTDRANYTDPGARVKSAAYKVNAAEREIDGAWETLAAMKEKLYEVETGGMTAEMQGTRAILEKAARQPIDGDDLEMLQRVFRPDDADQIRRWSEAASRIEAPDGTLDTLAFTSAQNQAYDLAKRVLGREGKEQSRFAASGELDQMLMDIAESPESMRTAMVSLGLQAAQTKTADDMNQLIDMFRLLGLNRDEGVGFGATLGYNRSRGTLDEAKLRQTLRDRINKGRPGIGEGTAEDAGSAFSRARRRAPKGEFEPERVANARQYQQYRIDELEAREARLGGILQALGKESRQPTTQRLINQDIKAGRMVDEAVPTDTPFGAIHEMRMEHVAGMTDPIHYAAPGADWREVISNVNPQEPIGFRTGRPSGTAVYKGSPNARYRTLEGRKAAYESLRERAETHLEGLNQKMGDMDDHLNELQGSIAAVEPRDAAA